MLHGYNMCMGLLSCQPEAEELEQRSQLQAPAELGPYRRVVSTGCMFGLVRSLTMYIPKPSLVEPIYYKEPIGAMVLVYSVGMKN